MEGIKILAFAFLLWVFHLHIVQGQNCEIKRNASGKIFSAGKFLEFEMCWEIPVPRGHVVDLKFNSFQTNIPCLDSYVGITDPEGIFVYAFCNSNLPPNPIVASGNITVTHFVMKSDSSSSFELEYTVRAISGRNRTSFQCDGDSCTTQKNVSDWFRSYHNEVDEIEQGNLTVRDILEMRDSAASWLKQRGWREDPLRAVVALYLASAATFNGSVSEEEQMVKEVEFETAIALLRPSLTSSELSLLVHALLVTCHNPRQFYGHNLVQRLKEQVEESGNLTHPLAYLALCNANESLPLGAQSHFKSIFASDSEYPFATDLQAITYMALVCEVRRGISYDLGWAALGVLVKLSQWMNGGLGNFQSTPLMQQVALLALLPKLKVDETISINDIPEETVVEMPELTHLIRTLNSSSGDFLETYFTLPILNFKTLVDISSVNCSAHPRKKGEDPDSGIGDNVERSILVQYSLYIGEEQKVLRTFWLSVPENSTAFEVMKSTAVENPKYKLEYKMILEKIYVFGIGNVRSDPEIGKFWLLYVGAANSSKPITHLTKGPDEIVMNNGDHLVMWYKTAMI